VRVEVKVVDLHGSVDDAFSIVDENDDSDDLTASLFTAVFYSAFLLRASPSFIRRPNFDMRNLKVLLISYLV